MWSIVAACGCLASTGRASLTWSQGYTQPAYVPLSEIVSHPVPGETCPGDFGIVYSDKQGLTNRLRMTKITGHAAQRD